MGLISRDLNTNHDQTALPTEQPLGTKLCVKCIHGNGREIDPSIQNSVFRAAAQEYQDVSTKTSVKTTKNSQFYAGPWEFLQLANSSRDLKISFFASIFRC